MCVLELLVIAISRKELNPSSHEIGICSCFHSIFGIKIQEFLTGSLESSKNIDGVIMNLATPAAELSFGSNTFKSLTASEFRSSILLTLQEETK